VQWGAVRMPEQGPISTFLGKTVYVMWFDGERSWGKEGRLENFDDNFIYLVSLNEKKNPNIKVTRAIARDSIRSITLREHVK